MRRNSLIPQCDDWSNLSRARYLPLPVSKLGDVRKVELDQAFIVSPQRGTDLVALDDALTSLAALDERKAKVIELRFFGGLSVEETAEVLNVSPDTVMRDWRLAKVWLWREMKHASRCQEPKRKTNREGLEDH